MGTGAVRGVGCEQYRGSANSEREQGQTGARGVSSIEGVQIVNGNRGSQGRGV